MNVSQSVSGSAPLAFVSKNFFRHTDDPRIQSESRMETQNTKYTIDVGAGTQPAQTWILGD